MKKMIWKQARLIAVSLIIFFIGSNLAACVKETEKEVVLISISVTTPPDKTDYIEGEAFETAGMVITAAYSDSSKNTVTGYTVTPSGRLAVTDESVEISYTYVGVTKTTQQAITVSPVPEPAAELTAVTITVPPDKLDYYTGEMFDPSGMVLTAAYSDGSTKTVTGYNHDKTSPLNLSDTSVTFSYTESGVTKTAVQTISVSEEEMLLASISVTTPPEKTEYMEGEFFSSAGMVVTATLMNADMTRTDTVAAHGYTVTPETASSAGAALTMFDNFVKIRYTFNGISKTVNVSIQVVQDTREVFESYGKVDLAFPYATDVHFTSSSTAPVNYPKMLNETLRLTGGRVHAIVNGGDFSEGYAADYDTITGFNTLAMPGVPFIAAYGNHEGKNKQYQYKEKLGVDVDHSIIVNGFTFMSLNIFEDDADIRYNIRPETLAFVENELEKATEADPFKPVFIAEHVPINGCTKKNSSDSEGATKLYPILQRYPQAFHLCGHDHNSFSTNSLWSGDFHSFEGGAFTSSAQFALFRYTSLDKLIIQYLRASGTTAEPVTVDSGATARTQEVLDYKAFLQSKGVVYPN